MEPGDSGPLRGSPGSIEQQLDMSEDGDLRGDDILHSHGLEPRSRGDSDMRPLDEVFEEMRMDLSEDNREGAEMSGDEHSSGLQGEEREILGQPHIDAGIPGSWNMKGLPRRRRAA